MIDGGFNKSSMIRGNIVVFKNGYISRRSSRAKTPNKWRTSPVARLATYPFGTFVANHFIYVLLSSFARLRGVGEFSSPRGLTRKEHKSSTIFSLWCNNSAIDLLSGRNCLVKLWNN